MLSSEKQEFAHLAKPIKSFPDMEQSKYFRFHKSIGHNTENCTELNNVIEGLIRKEKLLCFIYKRVDIKGNGT